MNRRTTISLALVAAIGLAAIATLRYRQVGADTLPANSTSTADEDRSTGPAVVYGKVTNEAGKPLVNIVVSVGSTGKATDQQGRYTVIVADPDDNLMTFRDTSGQSYRTVGDGENMLHLAPGDQVERDVTLKKVQ